MLERSDEKMREGSYRRKEDSGEEKKAIQQKNNKKEGRDCQLENTLLKDESG